MIVAVSIPEESPEMLWVLLAIQRGPARYLECMPCRNRAEHVPVEVTHLHGDTAVGSDLEMQLALLGAQLLIHAGSRVHVLEHRRRRRGRKRAHVDGGVERCAEIGLRCR